MESQVIHSKVEPDPTECRKIVEWMAEAGITVDGIETRTAHTCTVCRPVEFHVAA